MLPEAYKVLKSLLEAMQEELKLCEDEVPRVFFPTKIETPFLGTIEDTHKVRPITLTPKRLEGTMYKEQVQTVNSISPPSFFVLAGREP